MATTAVFFAHDLVLLFLRVVLLYHIIKSSFDRLISMDDLDNSSRLEMKHDIQSQLSQSRIWTLISRS